MKVQIKKFVTDHKDQISAATTAAVVTSAGIAFIANQVRKGQDFAHKERQSIIDMVRGTSDTDK